MAGGTPAAVNSSHYDANQQPSLVLVVGTLGTADTGGTALTMPASGNPVTGATYVEVLGTVSSLGTIVLSDGTQIANTIAGDSGQNGLITYPSRKEASFTTTTVQAVAITDVSNYRWVSVHIITQGTNSTVTFQGSNDNTNWINVALQNTNSTSQPASTSATGVALLQGSIGFRYFRLNVTGISAGTTSGVVEFFSSPGQMTTMGASVSQSGAWNVTGTVAGGTIQLGTFRLDPTTIPSVQQFGTLGTAGGSFFATISGASGAGTKHYIQGVDIVTYSGTPDVRVLAGSSIQGTGVLAAGQFVPSGGITKTWNQHFPTGTNSEIIYHFAAAGTAFINVSFWKGA